MGGLILVLKLAVALGLAWWLSRFLEAPVVEFMNESRLRAGLPTQSVRAVRAVVMVGLALVVFMIFSAF